MNDVLHEQKDEPVKRNLHYKSEKRTAADEIHRGKCDRGANQDDYSSALEGIDKRTRQTGVKALGRCGPELYGHALNSATPARLDHFSAHVARGDAQFAEGPVAFVTQIARGRLRMKLAISRSGYWHGLPDIERGGQGRRIGGSGRGGWRGRKPGNS